MSRIVPLSSSFRSAAWPTQCAIVQVIREDNDTKEKEEAETMGKVS